MRQLKYLTDTFVTIVTHTHSRQAGGRAGGGKERERARVIRALRPCLVCSSCCSCYRARAQGEKYLANVSQASCYLSLSLCINLWPRVLPDKQPCQRILRIEAYKTIRCTISCDVLSVSLYLFIILSVSAAAAQSNQEHQWRLLFATVCALLFRLIIKQTRHTHAHTHTLITAASLSVIAVNKCICQIHVRYVQKARVGEAGRGGARRAVGQCCCCWRCCCCCLQFN